MQQTYEGPFICFDPLRCLLSVGKFHPLVVALIDVLVKVLYGVADLDVDVALVPEEQERLVWHNPPVIRQSAAVLHLLAASVWSPAAVHWIRAVVPPLRTRDVLLWEVFGALPVLHAGARRVGRAALVVHRTGDYHSLFRLLESDSSPDTIVSNMLQPVRAC